MFARILYRTEQRPLLLFRSTSRELYGDISSSVMTSVSPPILSFGICDVNFTSQSETITHRGCASVAVQQFWLHWKLNYIFSQQQL